MIAARIVAFVGVIIIVVAALALVDPNAAPPLEHHQPAVVFVAPE